MNTLLQDVRYAVRMLRRSPGFTIVAIVTLALGIGANTAPFGVVNEVLLKPLHMRQSDKLVMLWPRNLSRNIPMNLVNPPLYQEWREQNHVFSEMASATDRSYTLTGRGKPEALVAWSISSNFMHVLGVQPFLGRMFTPEEDQPGHDRVAVLTYKLWQRKFGSDPGIINQTITLNDASYTVIGVMPRGFNFPSDITPATPAGRSPSASAAGCAAGLADVAHEQAFFAAIALVLAAVGIYGVISYLVVSRTREVGVRMALGAQRRDILRLIVGQSFRVVLIGVALGLIGAFAGARLLSSLLFQVRSADPLTYIAVAVLLSIVALGAAWIPARRAAKLDPSKALRYE